MRFGTETSLRWWQAAEALATVPWDGRRRIDRKRLDRLEEVLAKFDFTEIQQHLPREFRFLGFRFELGDVSAERKTLVVRYNATINDVIRGKMEFRLEKTDPIRYRINVVAAQLRMDRFLHPGDTRIFRKLIHNFLEYVQAHF